MSAGLPVTPTLVIPESELEWKSVRASGPGGQNVNKVASKVELRFAMSDSRVLDGAVKQRLRVLAGTRFDAEGRLIITSQVSRDRSYNLEDARQKLVGLIRRALIAPKKRRDTRPTRASKERRLETKRRESQRKQARREHE